MPEARGWRANSPSPLSSTELWVTYRISTALKSVVCLTSTRRASYGSLRTGWELINSWSEISLKRRGPLGVLY